VDAVQVYVDFDPAVLEVINLLGGTALPRPLQSSFDNQLGQVNYAAGTLEDPVAVPFTLVTAEFRALARTGPGGTVLNFAPPAPPRQTRVSAGGGRDGSGNLTGAMIVIQ
jgi:hypothetical protein